MPQTTSMAASRAYMRGQLGSAEYDRLIDNIIKEQAR